MTDIVDVLRDGMWLLTDEQRREAADTIAKLREERDALKTRAEAAEAYVAHRDALMCELEDEMDVLRAHAEAAERRVKELEVALIEQWETAHFEMCGCTGPKPMGCQWPKPAALEAKP